MDINIGSKESKLLGGTVGVFKEYVGNNSLHITNCINTSRKIILEMLELRGYDISSIPSNLITIDTKYEELTIKVEKETEVTHIYYPILDKKTNHKQISKKTEEVMKQIEETKKDLNIIFIVLDSVTRSVKDIIKLLNIKYNIYIQVFPIKQLMYNITKHRIVPEHIRIKNLPNKTDFLQSLHINSLDKLPKILDTDPVAMFIGLKPGEICKIIRPSQSSGVHNVYRYCISE